MAETETGCVVAALGSEIPRQTDVVRQAACEHVAGVICLVASVLPAGVESIALHIGSAMLGALQLAWALGGVEAEALLASNRHILIERYT